MDKTFQTIKNTVKKATAPICSAAWYKKGLPKFLKIYFWLCLVNLVLFTHTLGQVLWVGAIVAIGYVRAHGKDKAISDVKKRVTKAKDAVTGE